MGCVAQSITNLCELDGWIKGALFTLPVCHSDNIPDLGGLVAAFLLFPGKSIKPLPYLLEESVLGGRWMLYSLCIVSNKTLCIFYGCAKMECVSTLAQ